MYLLATKYVETTISHTRFCISIFGFKEHFNRDNITFTIMTGFYIKDENVTAVLIREFSVEVHL